MCYNWLLFSIQIEVQFIQVVHQESVDVLELNQQRTRLSDILMKQNATVFIIVEFSPYAHREVMSI